MQAIFESKGDKLSSSAECRIRTQRIWNPISSRLNVRWQTDWAIEDQAKILNSTARLWSASSEHSARSSSSKLRQLVFICGYTNDTCYVFGLIAHAILFPYFVTHIWQNKVGLLIFLM